ncbi:CD225/dispanin family protein [Mucilaginibacter sp. BJC16-A38]|uniref:CD225/dispanin family protein n=1 Tax=Mucilaginibacter phenanthrenivorans TaxID=1234842 RepID=UPI0021589859|nr:CD225/dispanin family protein [Mucilaginibacter phenanthrenivorans]MCR8558429.1 CD225/dispanin family protein [Mucilaginibacter phenanthrenivorans]
MDLTQPTGQMPPPRPKNWLVESILVTIFCCLPFGIVGIVNAASVNSRYDVGDYAGALNASQQAGKWTKIGFFVGIGVYVLYILFVIVLGVSLIPHNG